MFLKKPFSAQKKILCKTEENKGKKKKKNFWKTWEDAEKGRRGVTGWWKVLEKKKS